MKTATRVVFLVASFVQATSVVHAAGKAPSIPALKTQIEEAVREFVADLDDDNIFTSEKRAVWQAPQSSSDGTVWGQAWARERGDAYTSVEKVDVNILSPIAAEATVHYRWGNFHPKFQSGLITEKLKLRFDMWAGVKHVSRWQIVPQEPDSLKVALDYFKLTPDSPPMLNEIATTVANPEYGLLIYGMARTKSNLLQLSLGAMQCLLDNGGKWTLGQNSYAKTLYPYLRSRSIYRIPVTLEHYSYNSALTGHTDVDTLDIINDEKNHRATVYKPKPLSRVILFYEGKNQVPIYRYAGKAALAFTDGHVGFFTPNQVEQMSWKP